MNTRKHISSRPLLLSIIALLIHANLAGAEDLCRPVGWAAIGGGVTGGGTASPQVVADYDDLKAALTSATVAVVHVAGTITIPPAGRIAIKDRSNKSIVGLPGSKLVSSDLTKDGSGVVYMTRCRNFMLRNLTFTNRQFR